MDPQPFEFDELQNQLIGDLGRKMRFVGFFLSAAVVLVLVTSLIAIMGWSVSLTPRVVIGSTHFIQAIMLLLVGSWTSQAGTSFKMIAQTRGNDIQNLMNALANLKKFYTLQYWVLLIALVLVLAVLVLAVIFAYSAVGRP